MIYTTTKKEKNERVLSVFTAAILVFQNNETAAMLVFQTKPVGFGLFSYVNNFFCSHKFARLLAT